jgi:hypothetical protein
LTNRITSNSSTPNQGITDRLKQVLEPLAHAKESVFPSSWGGLPADNSKLATIPTNVTAGGIDTGNHSTCSTTTTCPFNNLGRSPM